MTPLGVQRERECLLAAGCLCESPQTLNTRGKISSISPPPSPLLLHPPSLTHCMTPVTPESNIHGEKLLHVVVRLCCLCLGSHHVLCPDDLAPSPQKAVYGISPRVHNHPRLTLLVAVASAAAAAGRRRNTHHHHPPSFSPPPPPPAVRLLPIIIMWWWWGGGSSSRQALIASGQSTHTIFGENSTLLLLVQVGVDPPVPGCYRLG